MESDSFSLIISTIDNDNEGRESVQDVYLITQVLIGALREFMRSNTLRGIVLTMLKNSVNAKFPLQIFFLSNW